MRAVAHDKALHLLAGQAVCLPALLLLSWPWAALVAVACCAVAGVLRETYNWLTGGAFDVADILWTLAGGALLTGVVGMT